MSIDAQLYRQVLGHFPTGVTVVTGLDGDEPVGFTIGSFTSVSLDPPLVGFLPMVDSDRWNRIRRTGSFCVNVLAADQKDLAAVFFKPQKAMGGRFDAAPFTLGELGLPILNEALGGVECELVGQVAHGDHTVFVGEVKSATLHRDGAALELSSTGWQYGG